eukprot:c19272_g1_i1.p1 GENE.c19272_g1_i1~~c19272_g1_i1.p1  ORF type:complete len:206 (+),score=77.19 c19272_g1_i1:19-636(+)
MRKNCFSSFSSSSSLLFFSSKNKFSHLSNLIISRNCTTTTYSPVSFDTRKFIFRLKESGVKFNDDQINLVLEAMKSAMKTATYKQNDQLVTQEEILQAKAELNEKIFNTTFKTEIQQRHDRDLLERDFQALKSESRVTEIAEYIKLEKKIVDFDRNLLQHKTAGDEEIANLKAQIETVEARTVKFSVGLLGILTVVSLALGRLMM